MDMWKKAKALYDNNEFEGSLDLLNKLLDTDSSNTEAIQLRALIHRRKERYQASLTDYETLVNLLPQDASIISERGIAKFHTKDVPGALEDLDKAQELEPENPYRYSSRAYIKTALKDIKGAIEDYEKTLELNPDDPISLNNLGLLEEQLGRMDSAKNKYRRSDELNNITVPNVPSKGPQETVVNNKGELQEVKLTLASEFIKTIKLLFTNAEERKAFFEFVKKGGKQQSK